MNAPMATQKTYTVMPLLKVNVDLVQEYWQTLYMHDLLKDRLCDIPTPTWSDVLEVIQRIGSNMFHILDPAKSNSKVIAEVTLENNTGHAWQVHFSIHPDMKWKETIAICTDVKAQLFTWPNVSALYGITPVTNRAACITVLKSGFKKIAIMPEGVVIHEGTKKRCVDAMLSIAKPAES